MMAVFQVWGFTFTQETLTSVRKTTGRRYFRSIQVAWKLRGREMCLTGRKSRGAGSSVCVFQASTGCVCRASSSQSGNEGDENRGQVDRSIAGDRSRMRSPAAPFQGGRLKYGLQEIAGINQTALLSIKPFVFPLLVGARECALGVGAERAESCL
jgi:hypothetical protein